jgi:hypothetical protein
LGRGRLALTFVVARTFHCLFFWHIVLGSRRSSPLDLIKRFPYIDIFVSTAGAC